MFLGILATSEEGIMVQNRHGVGLTRTVWRKTARARWERSNLEMIVVVPWRKDEDETMPRWDGEHLEGRSRHDGQGLHGEAGQGEKCSGAEECS